MLIDVLSVLAEHEDVPQPLASAVAERFARYAAVQERMIGPDGSYPPLGRSLAYRAGAFQHLAQAALQHRLPPELDPGQVRSALTAVLRRTLDAPGTFTDTGWLEVGVAGRQPTLGESYISRGSLYLCSTAFLPLGLPESDPFWSRPEMDWTAKAIWSGQARGLDHAIS